MRDAKLPIAYRDSCANLLIPLNNCRFETYYLPWKCEVGLYDFYGLSEQDASTEENRLGKPSLRHDIHGTLVDGYRTYADGKNSKRDTHMKSASTSNSRSGWPRWMSCGRRRAAQGATKLEQVVALADSRRVFHHQDCAETNTIDDSITCRKCVPQT